MSISNLRPFCFSLAIVAALAQPALFQAAQAQTAPDRRLAPADEYFGPLKMSVLGIRNSLRDETARAASYDAPDPESAFAHAELIERSVRDWEFKYPHDTWLPRTLLALSHLYATIDSAQSRRHAAEVAAWLAARYPSSSEAEQVR
jgi:hypothetical protein